MIKIYVKGTLMLKKLSLFLVTVLAASSLQAQSDYDVSLKYGLTSIDNDDGMEFKNHTLAGDISFDLGYALKPRVDLAYVMIDDEDKWGGVSALLQTALSAQYSQVFDMGGLPHELYLFGGLGYEYVVDGHETFDSLPFFQGGLGAKYALTKSVNLLAEFKAMQVFDSNNDSDDEDNEFTMMVGLNFPFMQGGTHETKKLKRVAVDVDKDGVLDNIDLCANTPTGAKVDASGCAIQAVIVLDSDKDGVPDSEDVCPDTKLTENMTVSARGCPIITLLDSDNDGVTDDIDKCKDTPLETEVDESGCVPTPPTMNLGINFESNSAVIKQESMAKVKEFAAHIKTLPAGTIAKIYGYTDNSGNAQSNRELSSKRAFAVRKALLAEGLVKRLVRAYGKGSTNPVASNETAEGRAQNRRIEAVITH